MSDWIEIGKTSDFPDGCFTCTKAGDTQVLVMNQDNRLHVVNNSCPHAGMPLDQGDLDGKILTCPFHGYAYHVETGKNIDYDGDTPLDVYPVKTEGDSIMIDLKPDTE